jgi:DNA-3-methyladenine glycosylase II
MIPSYWVTATRELKRRDSVLRQLIANHPGLTLKSRGDAFGTLARSIVGQQISVKAADALWRKLESLTSPVTPHSICALGEIMLRQCGLSGRKALYLSDLAQQFVSGPFAQCEWLALEDEALVTELTRVKGIGRWTAEMFMIFYLMRPNVFPLDDIGLQRAISLHYNGGAPLTRAQMHALGESWLPWRSVATWYLWRSLEPVPVEY